MTIEIISKIEPKNNGSFPVCEDVDIKGGYQSRIDITDRNNIPLLNRKIGMLVYLQSDEKFYTLKSGIENADWEEANIGNANGFTAGGDLTGTETSQTIISINNRLLSISSDDFNRLEYIYSEKQIHQMSNMTTDGTNIWIIDYNVSAENQYAIIRFNTITNNFFSQSINSIYDFPGINNVYIRSMVYLDNYLYLIIEYDGIYKLLKINYLDYEIITEEVCNYAYVFYTSNNDLWMADQWNIDTGYSLYKINKDTLVPTIVYSSNDTFYYKHDSINDKIWICKEIGALIRLNPETLEIEITNTTDYTYPISVTIGGGYLWVLNNTNTVYCSDYDGNILSTVVDPYHILINMNYIDYDNTNNKICVFGQINTNSVISINPNNGEIIGIGLMFIENRNINNIINAGGYIWADQSSYITKNDIAQCIEPSLVPSTTISTLFNKNLTISSVSKNISNAVYGQSHFIINTDEIIFVSDWYDYVILPANPSEGQKHTIIASHVLNIYINESLDLLITTEESTKTTLIVIWSDVLSSWYIMDMYKLLL
jgi:hypothetical protein